MENNVIEFIDSVEPTKGQKFKRWCVDKYQRGKNFVLEHGKDHDFSQHPHFREHRQYGSVNFSIFGN